MVMKPCEICGKEYDEQGAGKTCSDICHLKLSKTTSRKNATRAYDKIKADPELWKKKLERDAKYRKKLKEKTGSTRPQGQRKKKQKPNKRKKCSFCPTMVNPVRKTPVEINGDVFCNACLKKFHPELAYPLKRKPRSRMPETQKPMRWLGDEYEYD